MKVEVAAYNGAGKCEWCGEDAGWLISCDETRWRGGYACNAHKNAAIRDVFGFALGELDSGAGSELPGELGAAGRG